MRIWPLLVLAAGCGRIGFDPISDGGPSGGVAWRDTSTATIPISGARVLVISAPACNPGDMMIATLALGSSGAPMMPSYVAPAGWSQVRRLDRATDATLSIYSHHVNQGEPGTYQWTWDEDGEGVAWISCYAGVDPISPVLIDLGRVDNMQGPDYDSPSVITSEAATLLVTYATHGTNVMPTWTPPAGTIPRVNIQNGSTRSGLAAEVTVPAGPTPVYTATVSATQDYAIEHVLALRPAM